MLMSSSEGKQSHNKPTVSGLCILLLGDTVTANFLFQMAEAKKRPTFLWKKEESMPALGGGKHACLSLHFTLMTHGDMYTLAVLSLITRPDQPRCLVNTKQKGEKQWLWCGQWSYILQSPLGDAAYFWTKYIACPAASLPKGQATITRARLHNLPLIVNSSYIPL